MERLHQNVKDLESSSIKRLLWKYFLPAFTGIILHALYNVVNRIFVGQGVGAYALSGLSAVFPIMLIMMAFGMLIGIGAGVRISISLGKHDQAHAERVLGNAFILMVVVSLIITVIGFLIKGPMLRAFGASEETIGYANDYLNIILLGSVFNIVGFSMNNIIRSEGNARVAMISMLISAGINLVLDPIFIFWFAWGVKGAAMGTIISQIILCWWVLRHFHGKKSVIKLRMVNFRLDRGIVSSILAIGFAPFSMHLASSLVQATFNTQLIKHGGDMAIGAMGIINSVSMLLVMSIIAINMASQPIIGFNHGAKNYLRVKQTLILCIKAATVVAIAGFLIAEIFPGAIIHLFNSDNPELLSIGTTGLRIFLAALPIVGFQIIASNYFQSVGKAGVSAFLSMLRQVIVLIPMLIMLPGILGLTGVWLASPVADVIAFIVTSFFLYREIKRLNNKILLPV